MPQQQLLSSLGVRFGKLVGGLGSQSVVVRACQMQASFLPENFVKTSGELQLSTTAGYMGSFSKAIRCGRWYDFLAISSLPGVVVG